MTTAAPRPATPPHVPLDPTPPVRPAREEDAAALAELSRPFVRSGALRERPAALFSTRATEFLVWQEAGGPLEGCVALGVHPAGPGADGRSAGVVYNFCVAGHKQGRGVGVGLLRAALAVARARSLGALFTATTGDGALFLRHGFAPTTANLAPPAWAASLDPRRGARILTKTL